MGMSTHAVGVKEPTAEYRAKWQALESCKAANVQIPSELLKFFDYDENPEENGMTVDIKAASSDWNDGVSQSGIEVNLSKLPAGVTKVRVFNSF